MYRAWPVESHVRLCNFFFQCKTPLKVINIKVTDQTYTPAYSLGDLALNLRTYPILKLCGVEPTPNDTFT